MRLYRICLIMRRLCKCLIIVAILIGLFAFANSANRQPLKVLLFAASDCDACKVIKAVTLPQLQIDFPGAVTWEHIKVDDIKAVKLMLEYEKRYARETREAVRIYVGRSCLAGRIEIESKLTAVVADELRKGNRTPLPHELVKQQNANNKSGVINIELGDVYEGLRVPVKVDVSNSSTKKMILTRAIYSCTCFDKIEPLPVEIKPGKSVPINIAFNSFKLHGKVNKKIWLKTSENKNIQVNIRATILKSEKPVLFFHNRGVSNISKQRIKKNGFSIITRISNSGKEVLKIKEISSNNFIICKIRKIKLKPGEGINFRITLNKDTPKGTYDIVVKSNACNPQTHFKVIVF